MRVLRVIVVLFRRSLLKKFPAKEKGASPSISGRKAPALSDTERSLGEVNFILTRF